jgi:DNA-nicking Smr family endonuclease
MTRRRLNAEEEALWAALIRSVRPLRPQAAPAIVPDASQAVDHRPPSRPRPLPPPAPPPPSRPAPAAILDSTWERRIRGGNIIPDMSIDLHGHSLSAAHARLNQAIASALTNNARVVLVVTGKPPKTTEKGSASHRGAIRGEIGHWLEISPHAHQIASVRIAHPRHGGDGALYVILRRKK